MLDRIEVFGYRRLLKANAYVGRKTVAFVGPNEAGKSSVLSALLLFNSDEPVPPGDATRSQRGSALDMDRDVVRLSFTLDEEQRALARELPIDATGLRHLTYSKLASGRRRFAFNPPPRLSPLVKSELVKAWPRIRRALIHALAQFAPAELVFGEDDVEQATAYLAGLGPEPSAEVWERLNEGVFEQVDPDEQRKLRTEALATYYEWARPGISIQQLVYDAIGGSFPQFLPFTDDLRLLKAEYQLSDPNTDADSALANILRLAQLPLDKIRSALSEPSHLRTLKDEANERLREFFTEKWKQEQVTVGIEVTDSFLRIDVKDLGDGSPGWISITERSDGLRTFVALAAFLESTAFERPPILLIDEAEQHLHQNAQGDLIRMLQALTAVGQVLYTTHSPACLPTDLGNGVRFVEPVDGGHSVIRHDFWSLDRNEHVGFNPLLIAMGAGAAAFSSLRSALIAEGVSDMLLLPTLIKLATGKAELEYQISPGVATASRADMAKLDFAASRVAYLVDGDSGGNEWKLQLEKAGVPRTRVRQLPIGLGLEDLLDRTFYLDALAELGGISRSVLDPVAREAPIKSAVEALELRPKPPGAIALAEFILGRHESGHAPIVLAQARKRVLRNLDSWVVETIGEGDAARR